MLINEKKFHQTKKFERIKVVFYWIVIICPIRCRQKDDVHVYLGHGNKSMYDMLNEDIFHDQN